MMWLKRKIRDWVEDADYEDSKRKTSNAVSNLRSRYYDDDEATPEDVESYTLRIWRATGGRCIQYKRYDSKTDQLHTELYVVSDDEDLGEAVTNIVVQQSLQGQ